MKRLSAVPLAAALLAAAGCSGSSDGNNIAVTAPATPIANVAAPAGRNWAETVVRTADGGYRMGNPAAPVTLVEYGSRTCPHCARFDAEGVPAMTAGPIATGRLSYEFRDLPIHAPDIGATLLGQCVGPERFFPMLEAMMRGQPQLIYARELSAADQARVQAMTPLQAATYLSDFFGYTDFVKQRGVTEQQARQCLGSQAAIDAIVQHAQAGSERYSIAGTPTFILNGQVLQDTTTWTQVQAALRTAGAM